MVSSTRSYAQFVADPARDCAVIVHRGIWSEAPENSLLAIDRAISVGADVVEIDVRRTADGGFVLLHDNTLQRMVGVNQTPEALALEELTQLNLRNRDGGAINDVTAERVPDLREVFALTHNRIFVHLDVKDRNIIPEVIACAREMGVEEQVDIWGDLRSPDDLRWVRRWIEPANVLFMAKTRLNDDNVDSQLGLLFRLSPRLCEVLFDDLDQISALKRQCDGAGIKLWCNTLDEVSCAGFTDTAALKDPEGVWGRLLDAGISAIQTDHAERLIAFLEARGKANAIA